MDGAYGVDPDVLSCPDVDLHSNHYYPSSRARLVADASLCEAAGKALVIGEYGWSNISADHAFFEAAEERAHVVAGTAFWSTFPHRDSHGFVQHNDGFTFHYPGDDSAMQRFASMARAHAYRMRGFARPPRVEPPDVPPMVTAVNETHVAWAGAALAAKYSVMLRAPTAGSRWRLVCNRCASDNDTPLKVEGGIPAGSLIRVVGYGVTGLAGPPSKVWPMATALATALPPPFAVTFPLNGSSTTGFLAHPYDGPHLRVGSGGELILSGPGRAYLVQDVNKRSWDEFEYVRFDLRRHTLKFSVDLSGVPCMCAGTLYLSLMGEPDADAGDNYCGIQTNCTEHPSACYDGRNGICTEVDLMEANVKAFQTTLHTQRGKAFDGSCNDKGCTVNWGNESTTPSGVATASLYGRHTGTIDTAKPFEVAATFGDDGAMRVVLSQAGISVEHYNNSAASNPNADWPTFPSPSGVPPSALRRTKEAMAKGVVLVVSLWGGYSSLSTWLNGQCVEPQYPACKVGDMSTTMKIWGLEVVETR